MLGQIDAGDRVKEFKESFLRCPFETFRLMVLVARRGESQNQGKGDPILRDK